MPGHTVVITLQVFHSSSVPWCGVTFLEQRLIVRPSLDVTPAINHATAVCCSNLLVLSHSLSAIVCHTSSVIKWVLLEQLLLIKQMLVIVHGICV
jgi:hypothetical protein